MNKAQYTGRPERNYPLSTETLDFIQGQVLLAAEWAKMAGGNYILSGCEDTGDRIGDGTLIIEGEVLPFVGGIKQGMIRIVTTKTSITAGGNTYDEARTFCAAQFGRNLQDAETYPWADFKPLPTNKFLLENSATKKELEALRNLAMPKGGIIMWSGTVADIPAGFALCDGSTVNGVRTPDLRGRFVAGYYAKRADESSANADLLRDYGSIGNTGGSKAVALAVDQLPAHNHAFFGNVRRRGIELPYKQISSNDYNVSGDSNVSHASDFASGSTGAGAAHENRPPYYTLAYIIKTV